jgi:acyl CoA:acetate/3-ketoacid CoA transferase beta subunit
VINTSESVMKIRFKEKVKLEKYADGVTEEDIANGTAEPIEVVETERDVELTPEQAREMGFDIDQHN